MRSIASKSIDSRIEVFLGYIKELPLTEERGEKPHAGMQTNKAHTAVAVRPWRAATARLPESLEFYRSLSMQAKASFSLEWSRYGRVVQVDPACAHRHPKLKTKDLFGLVYESMYKRFIGSTPLVSDWQRAVETHEGDTFVTSSHTEYFKAALKARHYYSIGNTVGDVHIFQVVWLVPPKKRWVACSHLAVPHSSLDICLDFAKPQHIPIDISADTFPQAMEFLPS